ncbi:response regulator transcription factor [Aquincola sp. S2]|uniref:Response regulator transcription factor n=1 Tax=Pseudaquabacterium terrae TaxID=2732868 RepID=A0ABX2EQA8_9BURK|nr:LytTR family DNA-binding domain-containing protein [Aquabacterium terrae]NRF70821.1 response regulator transcription factor [Aquabacterium terrae]
MTTERPPLTVLIVDDEPLARLRLRGLVEGNAEPPARVVGEAGDAAAALALLQQTACDVVLLDIAMPGRDGLYFADDLRRQPEPPLVVFVTAHADHALRAFEVDATDYLTKPVRRERLQAALLRVAERRAQHAESAPSGPTLVVSDRGRVLRVPATEVLYLKAEQKYVTLCSQRGRWVLDDALADLEQRLGPGFLRVHRNAVVAVSAVRALERRADDEGEEGWSLQMSNGDWLAVSRRQLAAVREVLAAQQRS